MSYNPGVSFDLSQITRTGDSLSSTILNAAGAYKQKRAEAKAADALWKALEPAEGDGGEVKPHPFMPKDQWDSLSWSDKTAKMSGFIKAAAIKSAMEDQKLQRERADLEKQRISQIIAGNRAETANAGALGNILRAAGPRAQTSPGSITEAMGGGQPLGLPPIQTPAAGAPTPQALIQAAMNYQGEGDPLQAPNFRNVATVLQEMQPRGTADFMPQPFSVAGMEGIVSPRTGSLHLKGQTANTFDDRLKLLDRKGLLDEKRSLITAESRALTPEDKAYYRSQIEAIDERLKAGSATPANAAAVNPKDPLGLFAPRK